MSAENALKNYSKKILGQGKRKTRGKNKRPEKSTEKQCMDWFHEHGFSMHVVEAKAVYSQSAGRYLSGQVAAGFSDAAGCAPDGIGCFVEFKAKGRLSTLRPQQREFLKAKILRGCFSCVVDSCEKLSELYSRWKKEKRRGPEYGISYLMGELPKDKISKDKDLDF